MHYCGTVAESSSPESSGSPSDAAIDIRSSRAVLKDTAGMLFERVQRVPLAAQLVTEREWSDGPSRVGLPPL